MTNTNRGYFNEKVKSTRLAQTLAQQLSDSNSLGSRSSSWANLGIMGQPCNFQVGVGLHGDSGPGFSPSQYYIWKDGESRRGR